MIVRGRFSLPHSIQVSRSFQLQLFGYPLCKQRSAYFLSLPISISSNQSSIPFHSFPQHAFPLLAPHPSPPHHRNFLRSSFRKSRTLLMAQHRHLHSLDHETTILERLLGYRCPYRIWSQWLTPFAPGNQGSGAGSKVVGFVYLGAGFHAVC